MMNLSLQFSFTSVSTTEKSLTRQMSAATRSLKLNT